MNINVEQQIQHFIERIRPEKDIRKKIDIGYSFKNNVVELFEIRSQWNNKVNPQHNPVAGARYIKLKDCWKIYWLRSDLKWVPYDPKPVVNDIKKFLEIVDKDAYGCFFG